MLILVSESSAVVSRCTAPGRMTGQGNPSIPWSALTASLPLSWRDYPLGPGTVVVSIRGGQLRPWCPVIFRCTWVLRLRLLFRWAGARPPNPATSGTLRVLPVLSTRTRTRPVSVHVLTCPTRHQLSMPSLDKSNAHLSWNTHRRTRVGREPPYERKC